MKCMSAEDDTLLITALVEYHDELRARNPDRARRAWTRARDIVAERGETIANGPVSLPNNPTLFYRKPSPTLSMRTSQKDLLVDEALVEYHADRKDVQPERAARGDW